MNLITVPRLVVAALGHVVLAAIDRVAPPGPGSRTPALALIPLPVAPKGRR